jgi:hypothetical protein
MGWGDAKRQPFAFSSFFISRDSKHGCMDGCIKIADHDVNVIHSVERGEGKGTLAKASKLANECATETPHF